MSARYTLGKKLATGGMAEIFQARVQGAGGFEKDVVVKRVLPHFAADVAFRERFVEEAQLAAQLTHPNIVQTYELVEQDGDTLLAMEAVHGADVAVLMRVLRESGKAMPTASALFIATSIADALAYAHEKTGANGAPLRLVHRDVTPSNVLVSVDGVPKLIDFGIAKAASSSAHTQAGLVLGKPWYLSPEQCSGAPIDGKSDVFALGVVLFQMLAGRVPFGGRKGISAMEKISDGRRPTLSSLVPGVPKVVEDVVDAALTVDPEQRPTAKALRTQLERALATVDPERRARDELVDLLRGCFSAGGKVAVASGAAPTLLLMDLKSAAAQATDDESDVATRDVDTGESVRPPLSRRFLAAAAATALLGALGAVAIVLAVRDGQADKAVAGGAPRIEGAVRTPFVVDEPPVEAAVVEEAVADEVPVAVDASDRSKAKRTVPRKKPEPKPERRPPPRIVELGGPGTLTIHADPWAQVWLGGKSLGMTWAGSVTVPSGKQTLLLKNPMSGHEKTITVDVVPATVKVLHIKLDPPKR